MGAKKKTELVLYENHGALDSNLKHKFQKAKNQRLSVDDFIRDFLMQFVSIETKRSYLTDLKLFFDFVHRGGDSISDPRDIQSYHFQLYRDEMIKNQMASATVNRRLVAIRSFMKWALAAKMIDHNPLDVVKLPKVQTEAPTEAFDDAEVLQMIESPDVDNQRGNVQRMAMVLLFHLGLRRSELVNLKVQDIYNDRKHTVIKIRGKGEKTRHLPLSFEIQNEIKNYLARTQKYGKKLEPHHFLLVLDLKKDSKKPVDGSTIYRLIKNTALKLGINKTVSPHSCRATVISHLLDTQLTPIRDVATFAGHGQITTTERYDKRRKNLDKSAAYQVDFKKEVS